MIKADRDEALDLARAIIKEEELIKAYPQNDNQKEWMRRTLLMAKALVEMQTAKASTERGHCGECGREYGCSDTYCAWVGSERPAVSTSNFDEWYHDPIARPMSVHSDIENFLKDYCRQSWNAAREATKEECAKIADAHKGAAARERRRKGFLTPPAPGWGEIQAEERGEDIAAEIIAREIRTLT